MRLSWRPAALSLLSAASLLFVLGGCAAPQSVSHDIHVKRGVTAEDDLIHFYGAPSQRIIRGDSEYFVYNARTMNITSADGSACRGTPVFIFSYETKKLSDLKCRESIPPEELSNKAGDAVVVGVTDSGDSPLYDASSPETSVSGSSDVPALAPAAGIAGDEGMPAPAAAPEMSGAADDAVPGSGADDTAADSSVTGGEIPLAGDDGELEIINR